MTNGISVLLLDQDPMLRAATALMLSNRGASVQPAATIGEALVYAARRRFDVMIVDLAGPLPRAAEIAAVFRERASSPGRFVFCVKERSFGAHGIELVKPFDFDELLVLIFGAAGGKRRRVGAGLGTRLRAHVTPLRRRAQPIKLSRPRGSRARGEP